VVCPQLHCLCEETGISHRHAAHIGMHVFGSGSLEVAAGGASARHSDQLATCDALLLLLLLLLLLRRASCTVPPCTPTWSHATQAHQRRSVARV
jgi:hypothetical protein